MDPRPSSFWYVEYFEKILTSVGSLWSSLQGEVYFMGGGAAARLCRQQTRPQSWILLRTRNLVTAVRINNFLRLQSKQVKRSRR